MPYHLATPALVEADITTSTAPYQIRRGMILSTLSRQAPGAIRDHHHPCDQPERAKR